MRTSQQLRRIIVIVAATLIAAACGTSPAGSGVQPEGTSGNTGTAPGAASTTVVSCDPAPAADCDGVDLSYAALGDMDLTGIHLRGAVLRYATLDRAILRNADLTGADLTGAAAAGADLRGADLTGARASGATFTSARLGRTDLTDTDMSGTDLTDAGFVGARLERTVLSDAELAGANFRDAVLEDLALGSYSTILYATGISVTSMASALGVGADEITREIRHRQIGVQDRADIVEAVSPACAGVPVPGARSAGDWAFHPFTYVVTEPDAPSRDDTGFGYPTSWDPAAPFLAEYVGCVTTQIVEHDVCWYQTTDPLDWQSIVYTSYRQDVTVRVIDAATGAEVANLPSTGDEPEACPDRIQVAYGQTAVSVYGTWPHDEVKAIGRLFVGTPPMSDAR